MDTRIAYASSMNAIRQYVEKFENLQAASEACGIPVTTLSAWCTGYRKPRSTDLDDVSKRTGIPKHKLRPDIFGKAA